MNNLNFDSEVIKSIFSSIGLANDQGIYYQQRLNKHRQIFDFLIHIEKAINKLSKKRTLLIIDCASGRSYLSFLANYYLTIQLNREVEFICIDNNHHVIEQSQIAAENLGFSNMHFICEDIFDAKLQRNPDLIYSLHACNTATDMTIAKGIVERAKYIITVSCCQHYVRSQMKKHPLTSMTKFSVYRERIADMLSDTMRSLVLDMAGYKTSLFDYVPVSETPKNVMIRAIRGASSKKRSQLAKLEYQKLKETFHVEPKLIEYINQKGLYL